MLSHTSGVLRPDRVSAILKQRGCLLEWRNARKGDALPENLAHYDGVVVFGSEHSANDEHLDYIRNELDFIDRWLVTGKPYLGICLGGQLLARVLGARVSAHPLGRYEIGYTRITPTPAGRSFMARPTLAYQWHKEGFELPSSTVRLATGDDFEEQAFRYNGRVYGLQFHPEITTQIISAWVNTAGHLLSEPGAHEAERQFRDAAAYDRAVGEWLNGFLGSWLDLPEPGSDHVNLTTKTERTIVE